MENKTIKIIDSKTKLMLNIEKMFQKMIVENLSRFLRRH